MTNSANNQTGNNQNRPILVASWPGMGNVAAIAAGHLIRTLELEAMGVVPLIDTFDLNYIDVRGGVVERPHLPRGLLFRTPEDRPGRPLIVFLAEAQPTRQGYPFVHSLLDRLREENVERVFTFASLASQIHPTDEPTVSAAATTRTVLEELETHGIGPTTDGRIGGLNGLLLGAAAEREIDGACLLAEIPFFAAKAPNYKAARSLLRVFSEVAGVDVKLSDLDRRAEASEELMMGLLEQLQAGNGPGEMSELLGSLGSEYADVEDEDREHEEPVLEPEERAQIERLFHDAESNRQAAVNLKNELDRLGVFEHYEDRFLDLFRR